MSTTQPNIENVGANIPIKRIFRKELPKRKDTQEEFMIPQKKNENENQKVKIKKILIALKKSSVNNEEEMNIPRVKKVMMHKTLILKTYNSQPNLLSCRMPEKSIKLVKAQIKKTPLKKVGQITSMNEIPTNMIDDVNRIYYKSVMLKPKKDISPRSEATLQNLTSFLSKSFQTYSEEVVSVAISNFIPYFGGFRPVLLYEITVMTKIKKYVIEKTYQQFLKLDHDLRKMFGPRIPKVPENGEEFMTFENGNHQGVLEICEKLQNYLRTILLIPNLPDNEVIKYFFEVHNTSPRSNKTISRCKSMNILTFEKVVKENMYKDCKKWFTGVYVSLMQKGTICKRVLKTEVSNYCIRISSDEKFLEFDRVSSFSESKNTKLNNSVSLSDVLDVRNELYLKPTVPNRSIVKTKNRKHYSFPTEDLSILKFIIAGSPQKRCLEFSMENKKSLRMWYVGMSLLIHNKNPSMMLDHDILSQIQSLSQLESNLSLISIDLSVIERNYINPPKMPSPPI
eukprot:TRINITY_DN15304_c0_g1_i1.p1 TRINITY_DN15304_c0_g1~~TRINITY_DN15304_c0_g1_i1.p1  ORF type:complete len:510 (-),score=115.08 TRINITY_DN15304_c0_g1_i1:13-1542(-)